VAGLGALGALLGLIAASASAGAAEMPASHPVATHSVNAALLAGLPRHQAQFTAHGRAQSCDGVRLADLLARLGLPAGPQLRGDALRLIVLAEGRDGYSVAFSAGELDPLLGNRPVMVADRCDGKALTGQDGPFRLVAPGEARAARSVRQLEPLHVIRLSPASAP
jgi:hypothetical protein